MLKSLFPIGHPQGVNRSLSSATVRSAAMATKRLGEGPPSHTVVEDLATDQVKKTDFLFKGGN